MARGSRGNEERILQPRNGIPGFNAISEDAEGERFGTGNGIVPAVTIGKAPRQFGNFRNPPAIFFPFNLQLKPHG